MLRRPKTRVEHGDASHDMARGAKCSAENLDEPHREHSCHAEPGLLCHMCTLGKPAGNVLGGHVVESRGQALDALESFGLGSLPVLPASFPCEQFLDLVCLRWTRSCIG